MSPRAFASSSMSSSMSSQVPGGGGGSTGVENSSLSSSLSSSHLLATTTTSNNQVLVAPPPSSTTISKSASASSSLSSSLGEQQQQQLEPSPSLLSHHVQLQRLPLSFDSAKPGEEQPSELTVDSVTVSTQPANLARHTPRYVSITVATRTTLKTFDSLGNNRSVRLSQAQRVARATSYDDARIVQAAFNTSLSAALYIRRRVFPLDEEGLLCAARLVAYVVPTAAADSDDDVVENALFPDHSAQQQVSSSPAEQQQRRVGVNGNSSTPTSTTPTNQATTTIPSPSTKTSSPPSSSSPWASFKALFHSANSTPTEHRSPSSRLRQETSNITLEFDACDDATGIVWLGNNQLAVGYRYAGVVVYAITTTEEDSRLLKHQPIRVLQHGFAPTSPSSKNSVQTLRGGAWRFVHTHETKCCLVGGGPAGASFTGWQILSTSAKDPTSSSFEASRVERFTAPIAGARDRKTPNDEVGSSLAIGNGASGGVNLLTLRSKIVLAVHDPLSASVALMRIYADTSLPLARLRVDLAADMWAQLAVMELDNVVAVHSPAAGLSLLFDVDSAQAVARRASRNDAVLPLAPPLPPRVVADDNHDHGDGDKDASLLPFSPDRGVVLASPDIVVDVDVGCAYRARLDVRAITRCLPNPAASLTFLLRRSLGGDSGARTLALDALSTSLSDRTLTPAFVQQAIATLLSHKEGAGLVTAHDFESPAWLRASLEACDAADDMCDSAVREFVRVVLAPLCGRLFDQRSADPACRAKGAMLLSAVTGTREAHVALAADGSTEDQRIDEAAALSSLPTSLVLLELLLTLFPYGDPASCSYATAGTRACSFIVPPNLTSSCLDALRHGLLSFASSIRADISSSSSSSSSVVSRRRAQQCAQSAALLERVASEIV
ncbi:hypothetical protein PPROV_000084100 [Pycnococcus provasolii]|uniref:Uncharacterized protein n=1 Tax=Pycnococcus provasolii TaxID=41880 RepID=A0A830H4W4_9CHLO|nr:hypothetical protein PPROV_000084100 [Pycnococcus provasolii]